jgi:MoxR-like ATPase
MKDFFLNTSILLFVIYFTYLLKMQLYEAQASHHGVIVVGPAGSGKTKSMQIIMKALTDAGTPHREIRMNPALLSATQMFGHLDVDTNEWTDGVFVALWHRVLRLNRGELHDGNVFYELHTEITFPVFSFYLNK